MKNVFKFFGIIAFLVIFGFSFFGCDFLTDEKDKDGSTAPNRTITIRNNTGYSIWGFNLKPSISSGGSKSIDYYSSIYNGESRVYTLPADIPNNSIYDLFITSSYGDFSKYYITITNGMTINFSSSDFDDGNKNLKITIRNRSGVYLSCFIKPSSGSDWGVNLGTVNNNSESSITLPFLLTNFNVFDIQMRSSGPENIYTKINITVSNGMIVIYTPNDSDNSNIVTPVIIFQNDTGYSIWGCSIKPSASPNWVSVEYYSSINNGASRAYTLPASLPNNGIYDFQFTSSHGNFTKNNVSMSYGMTLTFTSSDAE